jgi:hypothetical protein
MFTYHRGFRLAREAKRMAAQVEQIGVPRRRANGR